MGPKKTHETKRNTRRKNVLPPCRVCYAPAAGFHYGVNTCEACKGFFHRSIRLSKQYVCENDDTCNIQHGQKKLCQKCRYEKCVAVGMAKDAIKTGRYTMTKHTKDTLELQKLKQKKTLQKKLEREGVFMKAHLNYMEQTIQDKFKRKFWNSDGSEDTLSTHPGACCHEDTFSFRCFNNLQDCPTYRLLQKKCSLEGHFFEQAIISASVQSEPVSLSGRTDPHIGRRERRRILEMCHKQSFCDQEDMSPLSLHSALKVNEDLETCCSLLCEKTSKSVPSPQGSCRSPLSPCSSHPSSVSSHHTAHSLSASPYSPLEKARCEGNFSDGINLREWDSSSCHSCGLLFDTRSIEELYADKDQVGHLLREAFEKYVKPNVIVMPQDELDHRAAEHLEVCKLNREMFGVRRRIPDSEFDYIYASTGIDADNRMGRFEGYLKILEDTIPVVVKFSKAIPGFTHLSLEAMVNLIKFSVSDFGLIDFYKNVSPKYGVHCGPDGIFRCVNDCKLDHYDDHKLNVELIHSQLLRMCSSIQKLQLTLEEECVLRAILITSPDKELWSPGNLAESIYEQLHNCLIHLLEKRSNNAMSIYTKILDWLVEERSYIYNIFSIYKSARVHKYTRLMQDPLLRRMMVGLFFDETDYGEEIYAETRSTRNALDHL